MLQFMLFFLGVSAKANAACNPAVRRLSLAALLVTGNLLSAQLHAAEGDWEFMIAPLFLWGVSMDGEAAVDGNVVPLDLNFKDDVIDNMDTVFTVHFEARKGDLLLFAEYQYVSLDPTTDTSIGPVSIDADIEITDQAAELGAGYTVSLTDTTRWEILGGLRWKDHDLDVEADVSPGPGPAITVPIKGGDNWYQGFAGARVTTSLSENWHLIARGDYGYGGSDNDAWHLNAMADYRFKNWGSAFIGYRYMKFDYDDGGYSFDAEQQGPMLGVSIYW